MKFEDIKIGRIYFYDWQEFIIITSITKEFVEYNHVNIRMYGGKKGVYIERDRVDTQAFKDKSIDRLKEHEDAKILDRDFETNIIYFLFKLPKK